MPETFWRRKLYSNALLDLKSAHSLELVQLNTAIFSYEPVLKQLQHTNHLLLKEEILDWRPGRPLRYALSTSQVMLDLVARMESDLSCNLREVLDLPKSVKLDPSQKECFLASIRQRLSLVQGPPGK